MMWTSPLNLLRLRLNEAHCCVSAMGSFFGLDACLYDNKLEIEGSFKGQTHVQRRARAKSCPMNDCRWH